MEPQTLDSPKTKNSLRKFSMFYSGACIMLSAIYILTWLTQDLRIAPDVFELLFLKENAGFKITVGVLFGVVMGFEVGLYQKLQYCSNERRKIVDIFHLGASLFIALMLVATTRSIVFPLRKIDGDLWGTFIQWSFPLSVSYIVSFFWGAALGLLFTECKQNKK